MDYCHNTRAAFPGLNHCRFLMGLFFFITPLGAQNRSWQTAAREAGELIAKSRRLGGEVHARKARTILEPWWNKSELPAPIRLQRATLLQRDHHFEEALADLNHLLREDPSSSEAWLMKTTILCVSGRYEEARKAAIPLFGLTSPLLAVTAGTAPTSCHGSLLSSYQVLRKALETHPEEAEAVQSWARTALAEMAVRLGRIDEAHAHFRAALLSDPTSPYLLKNYATFMLEAGDPGKAIALIREHREHFPVVWMRARKASGAGDNELEGLMREYESGLREKSAHHGHRHGRDEAVYFLEIRKDVREAIHHASANWESQREPADLLILLEAALAADDEVTLASARKWIEERNFEDVRVKALLKEEGGAQEQGTR